MEIKTQIKPDRLAKFRAAYLENGLNAYRACLAIGLSKSRARANAYKYARLVNLEIQEAMKARGLGAERLTKVLAKLLRSKNERIQLEAMREGLRLLGAYPAPKDDPPVEPVMLSVDFAHLILPGEEPDYHSRTENGRSRRLNISRVLSFTDRRSQRQSMQSWLG